MGCNLGWTWEGQGKVWLFLAGWLDGWGLSPCGLTLPQASWACSHGGWTELYLSKLRHGWPLWFGPGTGTVPLLPGDVGP